MEKYSQAKLTPADLNRLVEIERAERGGLIRTAAIWAAHRDRLLCVCLAQGAAQHLLDGRNGIKDLDVWTFFARNPELDGRVIDSGFRKGRHRDSGLSHLGRWFDPEGPPRFRSFTGRRVDLFGVALPAEPDADPVAALERGSASDERSAPIYLAEKAVVMLEPQRLRVVCPIEADGGQLLGYDPLA